MGRLDKSSSGFFFTRLGCERSRINLWSIVKVGGLWRSYSFVVLRELRGRANSLISVKLRHFLGLTLKSGLLFSVRL